MSKGRKKSDCISTITKTLHVSSKKKKYASFHTFWLSHFEYCQPVWHFWGRQNNEKIEIIQKQSLRYVYIINDYSSTYQELLDKANRPLMSTNRLRGMVSLVDNGIKAICPVYLNDLFQMKGRSRSRKFNVLMQPKYNSKHGFWSNTSRYQGAKLWNEVNNRFKKL